jgi:UDP-N-acetylglucosamine 1-carboxyvinyltransferase
MSRLIVRSGRKLNGRVRINGAKNSVLPIIASSILASDGLCIIHEAPRLEDVFVINKVLESLGIKVKFVENTIEINAEHVESYEAPYDLVRKMRASFLVMGPLLTRYGYARIPLPGGCAIGSRPIDQHLKGFEALGAEITMEQGFIEAKVSGKLQGAKIYLDVASVGATENILMAATLANGSTTIENAAMEPEIVDLANYLNAMGAKIIGAGTGTIRIEGVNKLVGVVHTVIPDRIEAGTYMIAAAITKSNLYIEGVITDHLRPLISKLEEMGLTIAEDTQGIHVISPEVLQSVDIKTLPYPGFPTDMQSQIMALLMVTDGSSIVSETVFENRFMHVEEFNRMNASIKVEGRVAIINGNTKLIGAKVQATDLRAGAALVLAGLVAEGETEISGLYHIERGYVKLGETLKSLGADIEYIQDVDDMILGNEKGTVVISTSLI